jgi:hypothetical protein
VYPSDTLRPHRPPVPAYRRAGEEHVNQPETRQPTPSPWQRSAQLAGLVVIPLVALLVAIMAWQFPVRPDDAITTTSATVPGTAEGGAGTSSARPGPSQSASRALTDLEVAAGTGNTRVDGATVSLACGTGESHDRSREVEYRTRGAYQRFTATLTATEVAAPEIRTQLQIFSDTTVVSDIVLVGTETVPVDAELDGGQILRLRLTCQHRDTVLVISGGTVLG